ncbi:General transcription factor II-I repeat domain-containing protein 2A [Holothuria leucospilota]|uniref:General transcription factor II-I repeat domain-containing protein 2A n=1 Tax=Holothuria leucospilota TaxID=206669 RepID=A0A9Q1HKB4_HOLLE|nr:General transcription factor II-I repeat domain-containing protein 2A [Holothuria leucospilota]
MRKWVMKLLFLADITGHLNELNLQLQGAGQTVLDMYETWATFVSKLPVSKKDIETSAFPYFKHVGEHVLRLSAEAQAEYREHRIDTTEIPKYIGDLESEFLKRFVDFRKYGDMFSFLIKPESFDGHEFDSFLIDWLGTQDLEMQLIELKSSALQMAKFAELRIELETTAVKHHGACTYTCWTSVPQKFCCLKNVAMALLSVFGSTYLCERIFSHMKDVLSPSLSRLTVDRSEACVQLKVTNYNPQITELSKEKQGQGSH